MLQLLFPHVYSEFCTKHSVDVATRIFEQMKLVFPNFLTYFSMSYIYIFNVVDTLFHSEVWRNGLWRGQRSFDVGEVFWRGGRLRSDEGDGGPTQWCCDMGDGGPA